MEQPIFKNIYLATDHAGFAYKEKVREHLQKNTAYEVVDCGAVVYDEIDDYPTHIGVAAERVSTDLSFEKQSCAIVFGGSGQGEAITACKFAGVRTTVCYGGPDADEIVKLGREHNDANVLSIGARFVKEEDLLKLVDLWLTTQFSNEERHVRRIEQIAQLEKDLNNK